MRALIAYKSDPDYESLKSIHRGSQTLMSSLRNLISIHKILKTSKTNKSRLLTKTGEKEQFEVKLDLMNQTSKLRKLNDTCKPL